MGGNRNASETDAPRPANQDAASQNELVNNNASVTSVPPTEAAESRREIYYSDNESVGSSSHHDDDIEQDVHNDYSSAHADADNDQHDAQEHEHDVDNEDESEVSDSDDIDGENTNDSDQDQDHPASGDASSRSAAERFTHAATVAPPTLRWAVRRQIQRDVTAQANAALLPPTPPVNNTQSAIGGVSQGERSE